MNNKVALITGGARRIGASLVGHLHAAGYNIGLHYRHSASEAKLLAMELNYVREGSVRMLRGDLADVQVCAALVPELIDEWGRLDVLINNASSFYPTKFTEVDEGQWTDLFDTNVKGPFFLTGAASPYLRDTKGCVINISDVYAKHARRDYSVYAMSKAALDMMTLSLARELAPQVRVNAIAPGSILWPEGKAALTETQKQVITQEALLQKQGEVQDIARAVSYLIDSEYVTGHIMRVDGGRFV